MESIGDIDSKYKLHWQDKNRTMTEATRLIHAFQTPTNLDNSSYQFTEYLHGRFVLRANIVMRTKIE